jgi:hypothetical protein
MRLHPRAGLVFSCFVVLAALLLPTAGAAQSLDPAWTARIAAERDAALAGTQAFEWVRSLTTEVGPRLAGSPGEAAAVKWGVAKLKEIGLENVRAEAVKVPQWLRGQASAEVVAPFPQPLVVVALGGSPATSSTGLEAEVIEVPTLAAIDSLTKEQVAGKIVFYSPRMERATDGRGYGAVVGIRGQGIVKAAEKGALAVVIRSVGTDSNRLPHTGAARTQAGLPPIPCAALSAPDADLLRAQVATGKPVRLKLVLTTELRADVDSANVVGEVTGRPQAEGGMPEEIVLLGCHLDSWDLGTGAEDDGAGCAVMMETARRIALGKDRPRRTVRVVLFANEEFGLSGAFAYAQQHAAELPRHVLAAEADLGSGKILRFQSRVRPEALPMVAEMARLVAPLGVEAGGNEGFGGADLIPLVAGGVPVAEFNPDASRYFDLHHTANDTLDKVDAKGLDHSVASHLVLALYAAETTGVFGPIAAAPRPRR